MRKGSLDLRRVLSPLRSARTSHESPTMRCPSCRASIYATQGLCDVCSATISKPATQPAGDTSEAGAETWHLILDRHAGEDRQEALLTALRETSVDPAIRVVNEREVEIASGTTLQQVNALMLRLHGLGVISRKQRDDKPRVVKPAPPPPSSILDRQGLFPREGGPVERPFAGGTPRDSTTTTPPNPGRSVWHYWTAFVSWSIAAFFYMKAYEFYQMKVPNRPTSVEVLRGANGLQFPEHFEANMWTGALFLGIGLMALIIGGVKGWAERNFGGEKGGVARPPADCWILCRTRRPPSDGDEDDEAREE